MANLSTVLVLLSLLVIGSEGRGRYADRVPNSRGTVKVGDTTVFGLGHASIQARTASSGRGNEFGNRFEVLERSEGLNNVWRVLCEEDTDDDGLTNGVELCDPNCEFSGGPVQPACEEGFPTHPGIANDELNEVEIASFELDADAALHATVMILAWVILAPYGILSSMFADKKGGNKSWFPRHKIALSSASALTVLGVVILLASRGAISIVFVKDSANETAFHVLFGALTTVLAIIQPISGFFRAHLPKNNEPKSTARKLWEIQHKWTGRMTIILALTTICLGMPLIFFDIGDTVAIGAGVVFGLIGVSAIVYALFFKEEGRPQRGLSAAGIPAKVVQKPAPVKKAEPEVEKEAANDSFLNDIEAEAEVEVDAELPTISRAELVKTVPKAGSMVSTNNPSYGKKKSQNLNI